MGGTWRAEPDHAGSQPPEQLSLGLGTILDDIEYALAAIGEALSDTLSAIRFVPCR